MKMNIEQAWGLGTVVGLILVIICLIMCGCSDNTPQLQPEVNQIDNNARRINIITFDGCEYIRFGTYGDWGYCHKGNCINPIHIYKNKE